MCVVNGLDGWAHVRPFIQPKCDSAFRRSYVALVVGHVKLPEIDALEAGSVGNVVTVADMSLMSHLFSSGNKGHCQPTAPSSFVNKGSLSPKPRPLSLLVYRALSHYPFVSFVMMSHCARSLITPLLICHITLLTFPVWVNSSVVWYELICRSTYNIALIRLAVSAPLEPFYPCLSYCLCMLLCNYV